MMPLFMIIIYIYIFSLLKANLTKFAFQLFNGIGDFLTIRDVLNPKELPKWDKMTKDEILAKVGIKSENQPFNLFGLYFVCSTNFGGHYFLWFAE